MTRRRMVRTRTRIADMPLGSGRRALVTAILIAVVVSSAAVGAIRYGDLRRSDRPGHPVPPAGYYVNPFSKVPNDLVSTSEAAQVKTDLLRDGDVELQALANGDPAQLEQADTGDRLAALRDAIARNDRQDRTERWRNQLTAVVVGRLADPRNSSVTWIVEERGTSTVEFVAKATGGVVLTQPPAFDNRYWLVKPRDRYLIVDAQVVTTGASGR